MATLHTVPSSLSNVSAGAFSTFYTCAGLSCEKVGQLLVMCPFFLYLRQSPSFMQHSFYSLVSLATFLASISIVLGSLAGIEVVVEKGR